MTPKSPRIDRIFLVALGLVLAGGLLPGEVSAQERKAVVLSSCSVVGETVTCGCQKKELGGLARRAAFIRSEGAKNPATILVDAGDFGSHADFEPWMRTEFQFAMMAKLGYDVVTPGPNEMTFGIEKLKTLLAGAPGIKVVSANVTDKSGRQLWDDFAIFQKGGITFAVTGVTDKAFYDFSLSRGTQKADEFAFLDCRQSLQRVIPEMRKQADVTVVLLHTGSGDAKRVLEGLEGLDIAVVGHGPVYKFAPEKIGNILLVQSGIRGQYLGRTELTLAGKEVVGRGGECTPLGETIPIDAEFNSLVTAFNKKYDALAAKAKAAKPADKSS